MFLHAVPPCQRLASFRCLRARSGLFYCTDAELSKDELQRLKKREYNKRYREQNKEKMKEYMRKYMSDYRQENKEVVHQYNQAYKERNQEKVSDPS